MVQGVRYLLMALAVFAIIGCRSGPAANLTSAPALVQAPSGYNLDRCLTPRESDVLQSICERAISESEGAVVKIYILSKPGEDIYLMVYYDRNRDKCTDIVFVYCLGHFENGLPLFAQVDQITPDRADAIVAHYEAWQRQMGIAL